MRISEILRNKGSDVVTVQPDETVRRLLDIMREHNLGAAVVSTDGRQLAGIVSERDVVRRLVDGPQVLDATVESIMTGAATLHSCTAADTVDALAQLMTNERIRHVPVVDEDGLLAGIVSIGDVVKSRIGELQFERDELEHYVNS
ncbi:CBS domain-containing protein [Microlunatus elymi]|uniref:CBS domain-containing protein n=1 Tax=Microlunatus elymi TaxID=2596828 RepID=A0A516Q089_9ACTN|nr:CBS domain-containing protein [Microlunatus elymi]QDP96846.1 CBS domain-containing protein [Microlunatus elymi]